MSNRRREQHMADKIVWSVNQETEQWVPFFNWSPQVTVNGTTVYSGEDMGVGPKFYAMWKAWKKAHTYTGDISYAKNRGA